MIECTHTLAERWDDCSDGACPFCLADRIRELEEEVAYLKIADNHHQEEFARVEAERDKAIAMADEMWVAREQIKTERDQLQERVTELYNGQKNAFLSLKANGETIAAIRAKTIKECAHFAAMYEHPRLAEHQKNNTAWVAGHDATCLGLEKAIRTLAQMEERRESDADFPTAEDVRGILKPD
jgi:hypothetical protein